MKKQTKKCGCGGKEGSSKVPKMLMLVKVGNEERPASDADVDYTAKQFGEAFQKNKDSLLCIVTHHAIEIQMFPIGDVVKVECIKGS